MYSQIPFNAVQFITILPKALRWRQDNESDFKLATDTPYLALTGEILGVYGENCEENLPRYNGTALHHEWKTKSLFNYKGVTPTHLPLDDIFKCILMNEIFCISIQISLKFVPKSLIDNNSALVQVMFPRFGAYTTHHSTAHQAAQHSYLI